MRVCACVYAESIGPLKIESFIGGRLGRPRADVSVGKVKNTRLRVRIGCSFLSTARGRRRGNAALRYPCRNSRSTRDNRTGVSDRICPEVVCLYDVLVASYDILVYVEMGKNR